MDKPKSVKDYFDRIVPEALQKHPDKAKLVNAIYCFKVSGDGGGDWTVDLASEPPSVKAGDGGSAQCTIEVADEDFMTMLENPQAGMQLYFQGKLRVTGDVMLATKLQQFFSIES